MSETNYTGLSDLCLRASKKHQKPFNRSFSRKHHILSEPLEFLGQWAGKSRAFERPRVRPSSYRTFHFRTAEMNLLMS